MWYNCNRSLYFLLETQGYVLLNKSLKNADSESNRKYQWVI